MQKAEPVIRSGKLDDELDHNHNDFLDFDALVAREQAAMLRVAALVVGSRTQAEEAVQDAFATVHQRWASIDNPGGYLRTTVVNNARQIVRRRGIEERVTASLDPPSSTAADTDVVELRDALTRLTPNQRAAIALRYYLDLPDDEAARILGCRPATVRSHIRRALARLRKDLE